MMDNMMQQDINSILRAGYRLTPATMRYRLSGGAWIPARHLMHISIEITAAIKEGGQIVIVTMPARHGKSEFISVSTPIWFLDHWPHKNVILTSYGAELSTEFSYKVRDILQNEELHPLLRTRIRDDKKRIDRFMTTGGGGMIAAGVGGPITGRGGDLIIVDDYIKNADDSLSPTHREKIWNWFLSTAWTRREPGATVIVLATRWNRDDLIGRILEHPEFSRRVRLVNLPALAEANDPLGRAEGEALWPERYSREELLEIKASLGTYWFDAMYQQHPPASMSGVDLAGCLKVIPQNEVPHESHMKKTLRIWDLAATEGAGDYTAGPRMSLYTDEQGRPRIYITDIKHKQKSSAGVEAMISATAMQEPNVRIWLEQEPGSAGKQLIEHYQYDVLKDYSVAGEKPTGPIEVRAAPFLAAVENGDVYCVDGPYMKAFKDELDGFPDGDHDDIISACALGFNKLMRSRFGSVIWGRNSKKGSRNTSIIRPRKQGIVRGATWR